MTYKSVSSRTAMKGTKHSGPNRKCIVGKVMPTRKLHVQLTMQLILMAVETYLEGRARDGISRVRDLGVTCENGQDTWDREVVSTAQHSNEINDNETRRESASCL
jgi:hypothetical protein